MQNGSSSHQSKCRAGIKVVKSAKVSSEEAAKATTNCMWFHNFFCLNTLDKDSSDSRFQGDELHSLLSLTARAMSIFSSNHSFGNGPAF